MFTTGTCPALNLRNEEVTYSDGPVNGGRYPWHTVATYTCHLGTTLLGSNSNTCQTSGHWQNSNPVCVLRGRKAIIHKYILKWHTLLCNCFHLNYQPA